MKASGRCFALVVGVGLGVVGSWAVFGPGPTLQARPNDRFENYVMCTGACAVNPRGMSDAVWLLDDKTGRLLGTVIDRAQGKIVGWSELDLAGEFEVRPASNAHFVMTTGNITQGQAALYVAETTTGKIGVYTLGPDPAAQVGVVIRRHDLTTFRRAGG
jgi:hypothetical protein